MATDSDSFASEWYILVASMCFNIVLSVALIIILNLATKKYAAGSASTKTLRYLYCIFISGALCGIDCMLCHISDNFHPLFCEWGVPICVVLYFVTKAFLYLFLIERAKCAQGMAPMIPVVVFDVILPIYVVLYLLFYVITLMVFFRGAVYDETKYGLLEKPGVTGCIFNDGLVEIFWVGAALDIINTFGLLFLFIYPLHQLIKQHRKMYQRAQSRNISYDDIDLDAFTGDSEHDQCNNEGHLKSTSALKQIDSGYDDDTLQLMTTAKISLIATFICTTSCATLLVFDAASMFSTYVWFMGNLDMTINSLMTFCMISANRAYVSNDIFCGCGGLKCQKLLNCRHYKR